MIAPAPTAGWGAVSLFSFRSIRTRMTLAFAAYISCLVLVLLWVYLLHGNRQDRIHADADLSRALGELREEIEDKNHPLTDVTRVVTHQSSDLRALNVAVAVVDARGRIVASSRPELTEWPLPPEWRSSSLVYRDHTLVVALPWGQIKARHRERVKGLLVIGLVLVLFSSAGAWYLVGRTLSPLDGLTSQALAASAENLDVQLQAPSSDTEMTGLVSTLNDLLARLAQTAQLQGRFYAAASHELRTPLQVLGLLHEMTLSRPRTNEEYAAALEESHEQIQRLTRLVQDLLTLNQLDLHTSRPEPVVVDLADICEEKLRVLDASIQEKELQVHALLPPECEFVAPWTHIRMLLNNLLENAVKYARDGGRVELEVTPTRVSIWNECHTEGIDTGKWFDPFYRPDKSRNSQTGGNGLGLSICQAICLANGWTIEIQVESGGICAIVSFVSKS